MLLCCAIILLGGIAEIVHLHIQWVVAPWLRHVKKCVRQV
jgi:hypothetical protein